MPADSPAKLDEAYEQVAIAMGLLEPGDAKDLVISRSILLEWLSSPHAKPRQAASEVVPNPVAPHWLLIFDNADNLADLQDFWPSGRSGSILITSRDPLAKTFMHPNLVRGVALEPLEPLEAQQLLRNLTGNDAATASEEESTETLARLLGRLPLVIVQIAAKIRRQDLTFGDMVDMVTNDKVFVDLHKLRLEQVGRTYDESLAMTWAFSGFSASATRLLELLSILDPDSIAESIIMLPLAEGIPSDYPPTTEDYYFARTELWKSSLVSRNKTLQQLSLHRLTQEVVRAHMSENRFQETFAFALSLLWRAWPQGPHAFSHVTSTWKAAEKVYSHIKWMHLLSQSRNSDLGSKVEIDLGGLLQKAGW